MESQSTGDSHSSGSRCGTGWDVDGSRLGARSKPSMGGGLLSGVYGGGTDDAADGGGGGGTDDGTGCWDELLLHLNTSHPFTLTIISI